MPAKPQHCPYAPQPHEYGSNAQCLLPLDTSPPPLRRQHKTYPASNRKHPVLCASRRPDSDDGPQHYSKQASTWHQEHNAKNKTIPWLFGHSLRHNSAIPCIGYDLNIHSDTSFHPRQTHTAEHAGTSSWDGNRISHSQSNSMEHFYLVCNITVCCCICCRGRTWYINCKHTTIFWLNLEEMSHPQPPTPINCDNSTMVGIVNNTVKHQCSQSLEMRFFWVADAVEAGKFDIKYYPGKENLGKYQSKHHIGAHHIAVCPRYVHKQASVGELPRASKPSTLKWCVGILPDG